AVGGARTGVSRSSRARAEARAARPGAADARAPVARTSLPEPLRDLVDLLSRRHALPAVWELRGPSLSYKVLVQRLAAPEAQVSQRLRELRDSGLLEIDEAGDYRLTGEGRR